MRSITLIQKRIFRTLAFLCFAAAFLFTTVFTAYAGSTNIVKKSKALITPDYTVIRTREPIKQQLPVPTANQPAASVPETKETVPSEPSENNTTENNPDISEQPDETKVVETKEEEYPKTDLRYWYEGIDTEKYAERLHDAAYHIPTTGKGYCASWVSYVYQDAGLGFISGNACDMWRAFGISTDISEIQEGMLIAVPSYPYSELGKIYGHVGVLILNPDYIDPREEELALESELENLLYDQEMVSAKAERIKNSVKIQALQKKLEELKNLEPKNYLLQDFEISVDRYGHEKWLVVDNIGRIVESRLSQWLIRYNSLGNVAWGWGHYYTKPVKWVGEIASGVPFVYHETEATEEDLEKESTEEKEEETKEEKESSENPTEKTEEPETSTQPETESTHAQETPATPEPETEAPTEPAAEPETEPAQETPTEPAPVPETPTEPVTEPVIEPEPITEPITEPVPEPVIEETLPPEPIPEETIPEIPAPEQEAENME